MFERIIRFAIEQRWLVLLAVLAMAGLGIYNYQRLPIDAAAADTWAMSSTTAPSPRACATA